MLILKIMSGQDLPDADPSKEFLLIADVVRVRFSTDKATKFERSELGFDAVETVTDLRASFAHVVVDDAVFGSRDETHLLTGNCYVLNDRGKTIESFWARRNATGEQVSE